MIRPEEMSKLTIIGPKSLSYDIVDKLHKLSIFHIVDHKKTEELDIGSPLGSSDEISEVLVKIRGICSFLGIVLPDEKDAGSSSQASSYGQADLSSLKQKVEKLNDQIMDRSSQIKSAEDSVRAMAEKKEILEKIDSLRLSLDSFWQYENLDFLLGTVDDAGTLAEDIKKYSKQIPNMAGKIRAVSKKTEGRGAAAVFFHKEYRQNAAEMLSKRGFAEIDASFIMQEGLKGKPSDEIQKLSLSIKSLQKKQLLLKKEIDDLRNQWSKKLIEAESALSIESEKAEAPLRFGSTEHAFIINSWVPSKDLALAMEEIGQTSKGKVFMESKKITKDDSVPIKLKHPSPVKHFEWFTNLYTLPNYKEIDPTIFMFITFPLFYGFMLGDVGYGLVILCLFIFLRSRIKGDFRSLVNAMIFAAISTIIFGVLFAEYFGVELYHPILAERLHDTQGMLIMALLIGVAHVNIGLLIGFYNELKAHGFVAAVFEKLSWIMLEVSALLIALSYIDSFAVRPQKWVGFTFLALSIIMIYKGEGAKGLVEIPAIFSHILSYARLMAVGLASVILAVVVNDIAGGLFSLGILGAIGGVIVAVCGHAINICIGLISPFLHSLRLHYVEFFTKFYHGGGMRYAPFGADRQLE